MHIMPGYWRTLVSIWFAASLLAYHPAFAQVDAGTVSGIVRDESGHGAAGVKVTLRNEETSFTRTTITRDDGSFIFTPVKIGRYAVSAELPGFATVAQHGIAVAIQQQVVLDFNLQKGDQGSTVEVAAPASASPQSSPSGQVVGSSQLNSLPLNGRNFVFLAQLIAGVTTAGASSKELLKSGSFSANGIWQSQNNYLLDGVDNNNRYFDFLPGISYVVEPVMDGVDEFRVETPVYSAALGASAGAVLNVTSKSGTNQYHGSAWDYFGNDVLNAADFFDNAANLPTAKMRKNQYGATLGGPLSIPNVYNGRDKTFFFADYQGTKIRQGVPTVTTVPTTGERTSGFTDFSDLTNGQPKCTRGPDLLGRTVNCGTIFDPATTRLVTTGQLDPVTGLTASGTGYVREPFAGNQIPSNRVSLTAAALLYLYPVPNGPGVYNNYATNSNRREDDNTFDIRVDHNLSAKDQVFGRFNYDNFPQQSLGPFEGITDGGGFTQVATSHSAVFSEIHTFSSDLINELQVGVNRLHAQRQQPYANDLTDIPAQNGILGILQATGNGGLPTIDIGNLSQFGSSPYLPANIDNTAIQVSDTITKIYGAHTVKGGGEALQIRVSGIEPPYSRGLFGFSGNFTSIPNMLDATTGVAQFVVKPETASTPFGVNYVGGPNLVYASNISNIDDKRYYYAAFVQDDWKALPKLTINAGVRWEYFQPFRERYAAEANFVPNSSGSSSTYLIPSSRTNEPALSTSFTDTLTDDGIAISYPSRKSLLNSSKANLSPRIGAAYQLTPRIVIRGGFGFFYGGLENLGVASNLGGNYPFQVNYMFTSPNDGTPIIYNQTGANATIEQGLTSVTLSPSAANANQLALKGIKQKMLTPYTKNYNVSAEYRLSPNNSVELAYVGSTGQDLYSNVGLNEVSQILPAYQDRQAFVPYQNFAYGSSYVTMQGISDYRAGQLRFMHSTSHGLMFLADYTYSKARTDALNPLNYPFGQIYRAPNIAGFGVHGDYGLADFDIRNAVHFSGSYELPIGQGKRFLGGDGGGIFAKILGGWAVNWILTLQDGQPVTIPCSIATASGVGCDALLVPGEPVSGGPHSVNQYWNPAAFTNPAVAISTGQSDLTPLGGAPTQAVGPGLHRIDFSLRKILKLSETTKLEFRAEAFNLTNHPNFAQPSNLNFSDPVHFGQINSTLENPNDARQIQIAVRVYF
jgi:hypothetical protein